MIRAAVSDDPADPLLPSAWDGAEAGCRVGRAIGVATPGAIARSVAVDVGTVPSGLTGPPRASRGRPALVAAEPGVVEERPGRRVDQLDDEDGRRGGHDDRVAGGAADHVGRQRAIGAAAERYVLGHRTEWAPSPAFCCGRCMSPTSGHGPQRTAADLNAAGHRMPPSRRGGSKEPEARPFGAPTVTRILASASARATS